jgi:hypothetical protein
VEGNEHTKIIDVVYAFGGTTHPTVSLLVLLLWWARTQTLDGGVDLGEWVLGVCHGWSGIASLYCLVKRLRVSKLVFDT